MFIRIIFAFIVCLWNSAFAEINTAELLKDKSDAIVHNQGVVLSIPETELNTKWTFAYQDILPNGASVFEWIPKGEDINNWSELIQIQFFPASIFAKTPSAAEFSATFVNILREKLPDVKYVEMKNGDSQLVEWTLSKEYRGEKPQVEIARFISSPEGVYRIAYTKKAPISLDSETKKLWIERLSQARLANLSSREKAGLTN